MYGYTVRILCRWWKWDEWQADYTRIRDLIARTFPDEFWDMNARMDQPGGFYRVRKMDHPASLPTEIKARKTGITVTLSNPPRPDSIKAENFTVKAWDLKRTKNYGSQHYNEREWKVTKATLDGDTLTLTIPDIAPTWGMSIDMKFTGPDGQEVTRLIHNSIFELPQ